jgi:small-conductance mechanosensitive channel
MRFLHIEVYGNSVELLIIAIATGVLLMAGLATTKALIMRHFARLAEQTPEKSRNLLAEILGSTRVFFLLIVSVYIASRPLALPAFWQNGIRAAFVILGVLQGGLWGGRLVRYQLGRTVERRLQQDASSATTLRFIGIIIEGVLWAVLVLWGLNNLGVDITALVAGLGVGGVAVALAVQKILGDLFASFSIVLDKPFALGDFIVVGDVMGTVEHIGVKSTRLRSLSGEELVISNSDLLSARIHNFKRMYQRRVLFRFDISYDTPIEKLASIPALVRQAIEVQKRTRFDRAHLKEYGEVGLTFEVVYYVLDSDFNVYMDIQQAINLALLRSFAAQAIQLAHAAALSTILAPAAAQKRDGDQNRREAAASRTAAD